MIKRCVKFRRKVEEVAIRSLSGYAGQAGAIINDVAPVQVPSPKKREVPSPGRSLDAEQAKQMMKGIEEQLAAKGISLNFTTYGSKNEKMAILVKDATTGEVIREIPPKELQDIYMQMDKLIGIVLNRRL